MSLPFTSSMPFMMFASSTSVLTVFFCHLVFMYVLQRYSFLSLFLLNKSLKLVNIYIPLMNIIKLDAIDSTNDYLKQLVREKELENYTVVMAHEQTNGKGQLGAKWISEPGKNLTMSVLIKDLPQDLITVFDINASVAVAIAKLLSSLELDNVFVKWPNDIMADEKNSWCSD